VKSRSISKGDTAQILGRFGSVAFSSQLGIAEDCVVLPIPSSETYTVEVGEEVQGECVMKQMYNLFKLHGGKLTSQDIACKLQLTRVNFDAHLAKASLKKLAKFRQGMWILRTRLTA
jgi:hypothetical protein